MFVQHILNTKNNANLITVPLKTDLSEAISILVTHKIGVVIVSERGKTRSVSSLKGISFAHYPKLERMLYQPRLNNLCRATL
jgi:CBS domain-containing protein